MKVFQIWHAVTGSILWMSATTDPLAALDAMAHEADYYDYSYIPNHLRAGGVHVEEVLRV